MGTLYFVSTHLEHPSGSVALMLYWPLGRQLTVHGARPGPARLAPAATAATKGEVIGASYVSSYYRVCLCAADPTPRSKESYIDISRRNGSES